MQYVCVFSRIKRGERIKEKWGGKGYDMQNL